MLGVRSKVVLAVRDKRGNMIKKKEARGNTFVKNLMRVFEQIFMKPITGSNVQFIDLGGTVRTFHDAYPIVVETMPVRLAIGSGNTPVNFNDYNLENIIKGWDDIDSAEYNYDDANFKGTFKAYKSWSFTGSRISI